MIANMPNRKEREEIDGLKQNLNDIFEDVKKKQTRYKLNKERLEKQLADSKNK